MHARVENEASTIHPHPAAIKQRRRKEELQRKKKTEARNEKKKNPDWVF